MLRIIQIFHGRQMTEKVREELGIMLRELDTPIHGCNVPHEMFFRPGDICGWSLRIWLSIMTLLRRHVDSIPETAWRAPSNWRLLGDGGINATNRI